MDADTEHLLKRAVDLARAALEAGNPPFGSLLASADGAVLAEDFNTVLTDDDITAHPELKLARWAARELDPATAAATTMYTSCQPCGMCAGAIERSGLGRVVFALSTEQLLAIKPPAGREFHLEGPLMADEVAAMVAGYYA
jgi:tRNA(Arg) A34 adenosine deaminase TadA